MDIETRVTNLENMLASIVDSISNNKFYTDADIAGVRKSVVDVTPYKETKKAYYGEKEKTFYNAPSGNVLVLFSDYNGSYSVSRIADRLIVSFDTLEKETDVTIMIQ